MFVLESPLITEGQLIPIKYTCEGEDISPQLHWSNPPDNTKSFAIVCRDPDSMYGVFTHWVIYNIPNNFSLIDENIEKVEILENGITQGLNDFGKIGYGGPCPKKGTHRYIFTIYALDIEPTIKPGLNYDEFMEHIKAHILDKANLMGRYCRVNNTE
ncbi:MAG: YbhB/YbcL family Raf kinase inhibitor-like protein [Armatimonadota bacterium]